MNTKEKKKWSVVMATYNGERFIAMQLDSILEQQEVPDEMVVVDDCSSDKTWEILMRYRTQFEERKIQYYCVRNDANLGYKENFKKAISFASGDWILLCDQDDIWTKDKIKEINKIVSLEKNVFVIDTAVELIDSSGRKICEDGGNNSGFLNEVLNDGELKKYKSEFFLHDKNISPGCTMAFNSNIRKIFLESYSAQDLPHDYFINLIGALYDGTFFYNKVLTLYRIHENNTIGIKYKKKGHKKILNSKERANKVAGHYNEFEMLKNAVMRTGNRDFEFIKYMDYYSARKEYTENITLRNYKKMKQDKRTYCSYTSLKMRLLDFFMLFNCNFEI